MNKRSNPETRLSFGATLLLLLVLMLSAWGAVRFLAALRWWDVLYEFEASLSPLYLVITGAGWLAVGGVLLYGIWNVKTWARLAVFTSFLIWLIEYWSERVFFQSSRANLPFALTCSLVIIVIVWIATELPGKISSSIKSEEHEQPFEKPNSE